MRTTGWALGGLAFLVLLAGMNSRTQAQDLEEEQLFTRLSDKTLEKLLQKMRIPFERRELNPTGKKLIVYNITLNNYKAIVVNHGSSLQLTCGGFKTLNNQDISLEHVNEWNQRRRHSRAFVDKEGFGIVEADLDFYGGTNHKIIIEWVKLYSTSLSDFANFTR